MSTPYDWSQSQILHGRTPQRGRRYICILYFVLRWVDDIYIYIYINDEYI